ncbi:MAG: glycosyltransferase [Acidobacteria bacterium]|nr:glycosyltransferase [Acidobacteriota bacterium]
MLYLFWIAVAFLTYTVAGYPLALWLFSFVKVRTHRKEEIRPTVSLIIVAFNEAQAIESKIRNSLELFYPRDKFEIIVALDGSTDGTESIVNTYTDKGIKLVQLPERRGKHHAQMVARDSTQGEILVFTDASVHLEPEAIERIVANFADEAIGCVSSEDAIVGDRRRWIGEGTYIQMEMGLRRLESRVNSLVSMSGSFFAARRSLCAKWHSHQSSDFFIALHAAAQGLRAIVDTQCRGHYSILHSDSAELDRKVRTIVHGLDVFFSHLNLANPLRHGFFSFQLISHKFFRWLLPFAFMAILVSNFFLWNAGTSYKVCLILQACFYGSGLLALSIHQLARIKPFKLAGFFIVGASATIVAWLKFCSGEKYVTWQPSKRI